MLSCAAACFPLISQHMQGKLILTYPHPHSFSHREQQYLTVLAQHCQATLGVADRLYPHSASPFQTPQEQAVPLSPAASDEMATLLTALAGFLELGRQETSSASTRQQCLRKADQAVEHLSELLQNTGDFLQ